jgi:hypothetical protein
VAIDWDIKSDATEPGGAGCNLQGGRATLTMDMDLDEDMPDAAQVQQAITELLGGTSLAATDGRLVRTPPMAHPLFPYWVVSNITSIQGVGEPTWEDPDTDLEVPPLGNYALYPTYRFTVEFGPRPYPVLEDDSIVTVLDSTNFHLDDGTLTNVTYATEWNRYCDIEMLSLDSYVEGRQGQCVFRTASAVKPPHNTTFTGAPRIYLPDGVVKIRWYQVPYRYISSINSHLLRWKGRVNQGLFKMQGHRFEPGQLLYQNFTHARYTPPVQALDQFEPGLFAVGKLVDIELTFLHTSRVGTDVPTPANLSWIAAGHNLFPRLGGPPGFYYVTTVAVDPAAGPATPAASKIAYDAANPAKWPPMFLSFPVELLFTDPDT